MTLTEKIAFIATQQGEQEASLLAQALDRGVEVLYRESLIDAYLAGTLTREDLVGELGSDVALAIDAQRDAIRKDIAWGLTGG